MVHYACCEPGDENDKVSLLPVVILLVATHLDHLGNSPDEALEEIIYTLEKDLKVQCKILVSNSLLDNVNGYYILLENIAPFRVTWNEF